MIAYGDAIRSSGLSGLDSWNKVKILIPYQELEWRSNAKTFYHSMRLMGVTGDDSDEVTSEWEVHHFLIQHGRIVKKNDASLLRLLQIAYNAGQFNASVSSQTYTDEMRSFYRQNKLNNIESYVDLDNIGVFDMQELIKALEMYVIIK